MTLASPARGADLPLKDHVLRTLRLAAPVMASRAGLLVMIAVDTVMCGRLGAEALAFYGVALAPHIAFMLVGIGLMMGVVVLSAQADGAGRTQECGRIWPWRAGPAVGACSQLFCLVGTCSNLASQSDPGITAMPRCAIASLLLLAALPAAAEPPYGLRLPLDCRPGTDCWILRHVDHDPGPGVRDYRCGGLSGDEHRGTDFAIRDLGAMAQGVPVRAAAAGVVEGLRDGVPDVSVEEAGAGALEGRQCGNGVRLAHGDGWVTMYCHMRRGSIMVREGDRVEAGQQIGLVGLSGDTSFPHLHFDLRQDERAVDPFVGLERAQECAPGQRPFWHEDVLAGLVYQPVLLTAMGIAPGVPERADVRRGYHDEPGLSALSPALVVWVEAYWVEAGDRLSFELIGPDERLMFERSQEIEKTHKSWFGYAGERRPEEAWPAGSYLARVVLRRDAGQRVLLETRVVVD